MGYFYQVEDSAFIDYGMVKHNGQWMRGPVDSGPDAIAWLGAAQTFGRYAPEAAPWIVGARLDLGTFNPSVGGNGPEFFLRRPELLEEVNTCRAAVVQVMSARTCDNHLFRSKIGGDFGTRLDTGKTTKGLEVILDLRAEGRRSEVRRLVRESREAYVDAMRRLLQAIRIPKVLFWFSFRRPPPALIGHQWMLNIFPQITTREMVRKIRPLADRYVEVSSRAGIPQTVRDPDGNPVRTNVYYPSPEMHRLAAERLTPVLSELVG